MSWISLNHWLSVRVGCERVAPRTQPVRFRQQETRVVRQFGARELDEAPLCFNGVATGCDDAALTAGDGAGLPYALGLVRIGITARSWRLAAVHRRPPRARHAFGIGERVGVVARHRPSQRVPPLKSGVHQRLLRRRLRSDHADRERIRCGLMPVGARRGNQRGVAGPLLRRRGREGHQMVASIRLATLSIRTEIRG